MLLNGSAINIGAGLAGLLLFTSEVPTAIALGVYFGTVPYNVFLLSAVWRTAELASPQLRAGAQLVGAVWFLVMLIV